MPAMNAVDEFESGANQFEDVRAMALQFPGKHDSETGYTLRLRVRNRVTEIDRVNASFNEFADQRRIPPTIRQKVNMLFDELLNNIITYAFEDDADHEIEIRVELVGLRLSITIADDGTPFDPFALPDPDTTLPLDRRSVGGLGIHLVRKVMDETSYERLGTKNVVTLAKRLEKPSTGSKA